MNRTLMNAQAKLILDEMYQDIDFCEAALSGCKGFCARTIAHRKKRRHYRTVEELTDRNETAVIGQWCHAEMEKDPELTRQVFERIRPT